MFRRQPDHGDLTPGRHRELRDEALDSLRHGYDAARTLFHIAKELADISDQLPDSARTQKDALLDKAEQLIDLGNDLGRQQGATASVLVNLASSSAG